MLDAVITWLQPCDGQTVVDMTMGLAGHGREIIKRIGPEGRYLGLEWDPITFALAQTALADTPNAILVNESFINLPDVMAQVGLQRVSSCLLDAGISQFQMGDVARGIAQDSETSLDMRINQSEGVPAEVLVNDSSEPELRAILRGTLAEREARAIARAIVRARSREPIRTTRRLSEVILSTLSPQARRTGRQPAPALLAFRIAVNDELNALETGLRHAVDAIEPGGRLVVLTFHSAEFRVCRNLMRSLANPCTCPPRLPCVCGAQPRIKILTPKPPGPDEDSLRQSGNQCRSARLHAAEVL